MSSGKEAPAKKIKGRLVPSRFKQYAESFSSQSSSGHSKESTRLADLGQSVYGKTSTPAQGVRSQPTLNASAICNASILKTKKDKTTSKKFNFQKKSNVKKSSNETIFEEPAVCKNTASRSLEDMEDELDILYGEYQLALLLENKAKEGLLLRSKTALEKINGAFCYLQCLLEKQKRIEKDLNSVSFQIKLHKHLQKQDEMLSPMLEMLPTLEKQYEEIAVAMESVKHKLSVEDVALPDEESKSEIILLCGKISNLLHQILQSSGSVDDIVNSSETADAFIKKGTLSVEEIKRGSDLLTDVRNLTLSETSLKLASPTSEEHT